MLLYADAKVAFGPNEVKRPVLIRTRSVRGAKFAYRENALYKITIYLTNEASSVDGHSRTSLSPLSCLPTLSILARRSLVVLHPFSLLPEKSSAFQLELVVDMLYLPMHSIYDRPLLS